MQLRIVRRPQAIEDAIEMHGYIDERSSAGQSQRFERSTLMFSCWQATLTLVANGQTWRKVCGVFQQVLPDLLRSSRGLHRHRPNNAHLAKDHVRGFCPLDKSKDACGTWRLISSAASIHAAIASRTFEIASSDVSPSLIHPGRSGTVAMKPPPSEADRGATMTAYSSVATRLTPPGKTPPPP
jgi:hypothetical protein